MDPASELRATISELDKGQARIAGLTTLKHSYGSRVSSSSGSRPGSSALISPASAGAAAGDSTADVEWDAPYGSPVLTPAQQKLAAKLKRAEVAKPNYTIRLVSAGVLHFAEYCVHRPLYQQLPVERLLHCIGHVQQSRLGAAGRASRFCSRRQCTP
jgi:hypothetical protein